MQSTSASEGPVQLREVYASMNSLRAEILAELKTMDARWDKRFTEHGAEHAGHEATHEKEQLRRHSLIRWAVTTIMSGAVGLGGLVFGLWSVLR